MSSWKTIQLLKNLNLGGLARGVNKDREESNAKKIIMKKIGIKPLTDSEKENLKLFEEYKEHGVGKEEPNKYVLNAWRKQHNVPDIYSKKKKYEQHSKSSLDFLKTLLPKSRDVGMHYYKHYQDNADGIKGKSTDKIKLLSMKKDLDKEKSTLARFINDHPKDGIALEKLQKVNKDLYAIKDELRRYGINTFIR